MFSVLRVVLLALTTDQPENQGGISDWLVTQVRCPNW
jgi:hypothetical protein